MSVPGPPPVPFGPPQRPQRPPQQQIGGIRLRPPVIIGLVFVLIVAGAVVGIVTFLASGKAVADVTREPISTAGANPFMPPVGADTPNITPVANAAGSFPANTPGLYGGTLKMSSCDPAAMVAFLQANPDKAAAWAGVLGIAVGDIPRLVAEMTPVILRSDTWVTNHGFANGQATTLTSVLQAGTAVLVDKYGQPRVKCYCGNPLTPATAPDSPTFVGPAWTGFSDAHITVIQQTTVIVNPFTLVDPATNQAFERPAGTTGAADKPVSGLPSVSVSPTATTSAAPQTRTSNGAHTLVQKDAPNCSFSDAPQINGTITMTVQANGAVSGTIRGKGNGTKPITCGPSTATMNWSQDYTGTFTGRVTGGRLTASGTLSNNNRTTLTNCATNGQPFPCGPYPGGVGTLPISFTGSYAQTTGVGNGTFTVTVARPTSGTWNVR